MKRLLILALILYSTHTFGQVTLDSLYRAAVLPTLATTAPKGYGITPEQALKVGGFRNMGNSAKIASSLNRFKKTFTWPDGSPISYASRYSKGYSGKILDVYTLVKPGTTDTIRLYVDMYEEAPLSVPAGLAVYSQERFTAETRLIAKEIERFFALPDTYAAQEAKQLASELLPVVQTMPGLADASDQGFIEPLVKDKDADMALKGHLFRTYLFRKFQGLVKGQANPGLPAYNAMVVELERVRKAFPEVKAGSLTSMQQK